MTIQDWGSIGELVGGVAVIASLIYVGLQLLQNTSAIRANSAQDFADSINSIQLQVVSGGETARVFGRFFEDPESVSADDRLVVDFGALAAFQTYDAGLLQAKLGSLDADTRDMIYRRIGAWFGYDYYKDWWTRNPWEFSQPLMSYVETEFGLSSNPPRGTETDA